MRWFDRMVLSSPMLHLAQSPLLGLAGPVARTLHSLGFGSLYVPGGSPAIGALQPFAGNIVTSDPVRYTRAASVIEAERSLGLGSPTIAWADAALRAMSEFAHPTYPAHIRQPILVLAAGRDQITSTTATEEFAIHLRAGSHLVVPGARHEIMMEQDSYRLAVLGGVRRIRAGHAGVLGHLQKEACPRLRPEVVDAGPVETCT